MAEDQYNYRMSKLMSTVAMEGGGPIPEAELEQTGMRNSALDAPCESFDKPESSTRARTRGQLSRRTITSSGQHQLRTSATGPTNDKSSD